MTSLNSKLQLAVLNRKKGRNLLEKGFTLVELMIVIVIVGILSSVALPSFLNQRGKAASTEATQRISVILKDAITESDEGLSATEVIDNAEASAALDTNEESFLYSITEGTSEDSVCVLATGKAKATTVAGKFVAGGYKFGARKPIVRSTLLAATPLADAASCTTLATPPNFN